MYYDIPFRCIVSLVAGTLVNKQQNMKKTKPSNIHPVLFWKRGQAVSSIVKQGQSYYNCGIVPLEETPEKPPSYVGPQDHLEATTARGDFTVFSRNR